MLSAPQFASISQSAQRHGLIQTLTAVDALLSTRFSRPPEVGASIKLSGRGARKFPDGFHIKCRQIFISRA